MASRHCCSHPPSPGMGGNDSTETSGGPWPPTPWQPQIEQKSPYRPQNGPVSPKAGSGKTQPYSPATKSPV